MGLSMQTSLGEASAGGAGAAAAAASTAAAAASAPSPRAGGSKAGSGQDVIPPRMQLVLHRFAPMILAFFSFHPVRADADFTGTAADPEAVANLNAQRVSAAAAFAQGLTKKHKEPKLTEPVRQVAAQKMDAEYIARLKGPGAASAGGAGAGAGAGGGGSGAGAAAVDATMLDTGSASLVTATSSANTAAAPAQRDRDALLRRRMLRFVEDHKEVLNALIRVDPTLLTGHLSALLSVKDARVFLDFGNKRTFFRNQLKAYYGNKSASSYGIISMHVDRRNVFADSFHVLSQKSGEELRGKLEVRFKGEEGIDAGGLTREWYEILARDMFNADYALFQPSGDNGTTFQPNPKSDIHGSSHLAYFKFVGRIIGKAVADGYLLDAHFTRSFYKHMLGINVTYHDMDSIDPTFYRSLNQILDMEDVEMLDLSFTVDEEWAGKVHTVELVPGGTDIPVTAANKWEYVQLVTHHRMTKAITPQLNAFLTGFCDLIPPSLISLFSPDELELLIAGLPDIDIDDLRRHTEYSGYR